MRKLLDSLYLMSGWLAAGFIAAICAIVALQVGCNLIDRLSTLITGTAIGLTIPSYADFTGFFLAAASFLALAHTFKQGGHIRVTLVISHLPERGARIAEFWCLTAAAATSCYFTWYIAALVRESYLYNDLSPGMVAVALWIPQSSMLLGLIILSIALIDELVGLLRGARPGYLGSSESLSAPADDANPADNREEPGRA